MTGFTVRPEALVDSASALDGAAQDFNTHLNTLQTTVTSNNPWGGDEPGSLFGTAYVALLSYAMEAIASHGSKIEQAAQGLAEMAGAFGGVEAQVVKSVSSVKAV